MILPFSLLLLPPMSAQDAAPPAPPPVIEVEVEIEGQPAETLAFGVGESRGFKVYALDPEARDQVIAVVCGFGRTQGPEGRSGLSVLFFLHLYAGGSMFLEAEILNDAIENPPGLLEARYRISHLGGVVAEGREAFYDETGVCVFAGEPRFAPRADLLKKYLATIPAPQAITRVDLSDAEPVEDPDPTHNTHAPGSPRNRYHCTQIVKYMATGDARYLDRLLDFVAVQARRPYHLSEANGEPFFAARYPKAKFIEGRPELRPGRDTLGRMDLPEEKRAQGDRNGWDHEHMNVEELYAAYAFLGSRVARREMVLIAEELLTTPYVKEPGYHQHSARAFGWVARALMRTWQASGERRYLDAVKRMIGSLQKHSQPGSYPGLVPQQPKADHMADERWESPFMVAVAASAIALYCREAPEDDEARDLLRFCGDLLVKRGYNADRGGFFYDYSCDSDKKSGRPSTNGVVLFIPSALVDIAHEVRESERAFYLEPARVVYEANVKDGIAVPGKEWFYRWFLRCAREFPDVGWVGRRPR